MASNLVWTSHLQERLSQRGVSRNEAHDAIRHPDKSLRLSSDKWKFFKNYSHKQVIIVAVNKNGQWIILTAWSRQPGRKSRPQPSEPAISRFVRSLIVKLAVWIQRILKN